MAKYVCTICGYVYDDEKQKIAFDNLPADWKCPLCGAGKKDFVKQEQAKVEKITKRTEPAKEENRELTNAEMNVLMTNLAKGCEKQYMDEEANMFGEIAEYYAKNSTSAKEDTFEALVSLLNKDTAENYPVAFATAKADADRGALRVLTWSEKVTKIVDGLITRYKSEGTAFLKSNKIFVCEICGFIFIGQEPPEICPICKVPKLKIHEIGGTN